MGFAISFHIVLDIVSDQARRATESRARFSRLLLESLARDRFGETNDASFSLDLDVKRERNTASAIVSNDR